MKTKENINFIALLKEPALWLICHWDMVLTALLALNMLAGALWYIHRAVGEQEILERQHLLQVAVQYLSCSEADGSHEEIIDFYNTYEPSPRSYKVTYEDNWCAAFGSAVALKAGMTDIIPMECGCEQQINLFKELDCWREDECYLPRTGDYIYYVWDEWRSGDCTAWADHVGIVADTFGPIIKVIEGNKDDSVTYRYIFLNDICIRGYGLPDFGKTAK